MKRGGIRVKLIVGAALLIILAVVIALAIPLLTSRSSDDTAVVDIPSEPKTTWTYDWAGDSNQEFLDDSPGIAAVGNGDALVWPVFDLAAYTDAIGTSLGWYEGYDQQYDDGYAAGLEFRAADEAYHNDTFPYTVPPAHEKDYFPEGTYGDYDTFLGVQDGFYDAAQSLGAGQNKRKKPIDPGFTPLVALVNVETGAEQWSVDLSTELDGVDHLSSISAHDIVGSNAVAVVVSSPNSEDIGTSLITLDKGDGHVLSTMISDGQIDVAAFDGDIIVSSTDVSAENSVIGRFPVDRLDKKPRWHATVAGTAYLAVDGDFVMAYGNNAGAVFTGSDGKKADWGGDVSFSVSYRFVGSQLLRTETLEDGGDYTLEGWSIDGTSTWKEPVTSGAVTFLDGAIFTNNLTANNPVFLQRVDPADGSTMWSKEYGPKFDGFVGLQGNALLLSRGSSIIIIDLGAGTERLVQKVGDFRDVFEGEHLYYVPAGNELVAYSYTAKGAVWSLALDVGQSVTTLGDRLVLVDSDSFSLRGLTAK